LPKNTPQKHQGFFSNIISGFTSVASLFGYNRGKKISLEVKIGDKGNIHRYNNLQKV
jgi:hypothetical protein